MVFLMALNGARQEVEYVQNMFDCICSLMLLKSNQIAFGNLQGPATPCKAWLSRHISSLFKYIYEDDISCFILRYARF